MKWKLAVLKGCLELEAEEILMQSWARFYHVQFSSQQSVTSPLEGKHNVNAERSIAIKRQKKTMTRKKM